LRAEAIELLLEYPIRPSSQDRYWNLAFVDEVCKISIFTRAVRSIVWVALRCCPFENEDEIKEEWISGFYKEFHASQASWSLDQLFRYPEFEDGRFGALSMEYPIAPQWADFARGLSQRVLYQSRNLKILFPKVNRIKNVSQSTRDNFYAIRPQDMDVRTVDLETLYHETGVKVEGISEMRAAWKFNDLKPRVYYCQGGSDYWASRYFKRIATMLMESIPATQLRNRQDPDFCLSQVDAPENFLTAWDLSSFTTNLSELKFFVYYLACHIEESGDVVLRLLDYREGVVTKLLSELLHEYNSQCNIQTPFSIHRLVDQFDLETDHSEYLQQNSGMLGVAGNIGLSTTLHGLLSSQQTGPYNVVCVGDDALASTQEDPEEYIIPAIQHLGKIATSKFIRLPPRYNYEEQIMKFLKRNMRRTDDGLSLDFLFSLPIFPYIDGIIPPLRTIHGDMDFVSRLSKVAGQVGAVLWSLFSHSNEVNELDRDQVMSFLREVYRYLQVPLDGILPGSSIRVKENVYAIGFCVPPLDIGFDPREEEWLERLWNAHQGQFFEVPVVYEGQVYNQLIEGMVTYSTRDRVLVVLEDLGYVQLREVKETLLCEGTDNKRRMRDLLFSKSSNHLVEVNVLKEPPIWYYRDFCSSTADLDLVDHRSMYGYASIL
jgi:hypothetical protein